MADNHSKEVRSKNMSHIRSANTKPEEIVALENIDDFVSSVLSGLGIDRT